VHLFSLPDYPQLLTEHKMNLRVGRSVLM